VAKRRTRRSAEEARGAIIDATEKRLLEEGPDGVRLQDVARDVGISHPAILHHFGSREALMSAVVERAMEQLELELIAALTTPGTAGEPLAEQMLERVFHVLTERGYGRIMAWMLLSGDHELDEKHELRTIAKVVHARRCEGVKPSEAPSFEDTAFTVLCASLTLFGDAIAGEPMRLSMGLKPEKAAGRRFRSWLARQLLGHLEGDGR
jgi:AcrR family transcriptional regulator